MNIGNYNFNGPFDYKQNFKPGYPGIYAVVNQDMSMIYIGITHDLQERMSSHEKKPCWDRYCTTSSSLYFLSEPNEINRENIERELLAQYNTPCNEQLN